MSTATAASPSTLTAQDRLSGRWLVGIFAAALVLCFAQRPGMISPDTKLDLTANPLRFLAAGMQWCKKAQALGTLDDDAAEWMRRNGGSR